MNNNKNKQPDTQNKPALPNLGQKTYTEYKAPHPWVTWYNNNNNNKHNIQYISEYMCVDIWSPHIQVNSSFKLYGDVPSDWICTAVVFRASDCISLYWWRTNPPAPVLSTQVPPPHVFPFLSLHFVICHACVAVLLLCFLYLAELWPDRCRLNTPPTPPLSFSLTHTNIKCQNKVQILCNSCNIQHTHNASPCFRSA